MQTTKISARLRAILCAQSDGWLAWHRKGPGVPCPFRKGSAKRRGWLRGYASARRAERGNWKRP